MIDATCECGELLGTYGEEVLGTMILICPKCELSNHWQSLVSFGDPAEPDITQNCEGQKEPSSCTK